MTQEEKKILFKELCARLAYGVKVKVECTAANGEKIEDEGVLNSIFINEFGTIYVCVDEIEYELEHLKPYLRPMSSMTEEEKDYVVKHSLGYTANIGGGKKDEKLYFHFKAESFDWLNKNMFDYRGLIPKDLALSTEIYNPYVEV